MSKSGQGKQSGIGGNALPMLATDAQPRTMAAAKKSLRSIGLIVLLFEADFQLMNATSNGGKSQTQKLSVGILRQAGRGYNSDFPQGFWEK
jgi:hypothetical protein